MRGTRDIISGHDWCERISSNAGDGQLVEIPGQPHAALRGGAAASPQPCSPQQVSKPKLALEHRLEQRWRRTVIKRQRPGATRRGGAGAGAGAGKVYCVHSFLQVFHARVGSGPEVLELRSITLGDRQCRSYFIAYDKGVACSTRDRSEPAAVFVLIHGIGMSHRYFRRLGAVLAAHGDVHLIDLPGYGCEKTGPCRE
ncbi:alpha/beta fold hydrolase [Arthrobacter agilis]|uniref:alpha/beta fold hydrolase n=1 Tax=Arthrobacter agilis TaxID=37921 RepID=UPI00361E423A